MLAGEELEGSYDGHVNCFIESGFHKALLIDFNYEVEPLPGRYPEPHVGPLPLLRESRLNHLGKLAFQPLYWHMLLPGRDIPGIGARMSMAGKQLEANGKGESEMSTVTYAGAPVDVDPEGFLTEPEQWNARDRRSRSPPRPASRSSPTAIGW